MRQRRSDFPVHEHDYALGMNEQPVLLDGMEVLFDKTVGLAPVALVPTAPDSKVGKGSSNASGKG